MLTADLLMAIVFFSYGVSLLFRLVLWETFLQKKASKGLSTYPSGNIKNDDDKTLVVIIPVLREQQIISDTLEYFARACIDPIRYRIIVVTTAAESTQAQLPTTMDVVDNCILRINEMVGEPICKRIHYPYINGWMAHQINYGVRYLFEAFDREIDEEKTIVAIFNADSRPDMGLLTEATHSISNSTPVRQAHCIYFVSAKKSHGFQFLIAGAAAIWQTRWSFGVEYWRQRLANLLSHYTHIPFYRFLKIFPFNYAVGHGLLIRMRELIEINYLPTFAPNEDAALGYILPFYEMCLRPTIHPDRAQVEISIRKLLQQQAGWIVGPAMGASYYRYAIGNGLGESRWMAGAMCVQAWWDAIVWVLGPLMLMVAILISACISTTQTSFALYAILGYLWIPSLLLIPKAVDIFPDLTYPRLTFLSCLVCLPFFYLLHGVGGGLGLIRLSYNHLSSRPYVKYKTER